MSCLASLSVLLPISLLLFSAQSHRPRIAVASFTHETNTFNPARTTLADFGWPATSKSALPSDWDKSDTVAGGYAEGARLYGLDLVPIIDVGATPKGIVTDEAFETLTNELMRRLKAEPKLDGVLLDLHGAMVVESYLSGDAEIVRRVRAAMGKDFPIVVTHDFHANVTPEIIRDSNALITFKENPHIDTRECGLHAARIMSEIVSGKVKPVQAIVKPPMVYNIVFQYTKRPPLLPVVEESRKLEENPKILAASVSGGYQYADVPQMGPSVIVVTDNDRALAHREAQRLSDMLWATRSQLRFNLPDATTAVKQAMASDKFPVVLVDMGDNIGGGSAGDGTFMLTELLRQRAQGWVIVIADPQAVQTAVRGGVGQSFDEMVGGKTDKLHGDPVHLRGKVRSLHDGQYIEPEVRHGGGHYKNQGLTAVIAADGSTPDLPNLLVLTTLREPPYSLQQLISCGIDPRRQKILVVKAAIAYRAAYEPIAGRIIEVDTPGVTAVNASRFTYLHVRRPLFGLDK